MKSLAIAIGIISLLSAPQALAERSQAIFHSQASFHSQGDEHKSEMGELHDKEAWDPEELENEDNEESPTPTATSTPTASPTGSPVETATPTETPTGAATPTESPTATPTSTATTLTLEENSGLSNLINQIIEFFQSLLPTQ